MRSTVTVGGVHRIDQADKLVAAFIVAVVAAAGLVKAAAGPEWLIVALGAIGVAAAVLALGLTGLEFRRAARQPLPLAESLEAMLNLQRERSERADVPVLTPQVLIALLSPENGVAMRAFDAILPGLSGNVRSRLEDYVKSDLSKRDLHFEAFRWDQRPEVHAASALAKREGASEIGQRHLLRAVLESRSVTIDQLASLLGEPGFRELLTLVRRAPTPAPGTPGTILQET